MGLGAGGMVGHLQFTGVVGCRHTQGACHLAHQQRVGSMHCAFHRRIGHAGTRDIGQDATEANRDQQQGFKTLANGQEQ